MPRHEESTDRPAQSEYDALIEARDMTLRYEAEQAAEAQIEAEKIERAYRHAAFLDEYAA